MRHTTLEEFINDYLSAAGHKYRTSETQLRTLLEQDPSAVKETIARNQQYGVLIDYPFAHYLKLGIEASLEHGAGAGSRISFDPWDKLEGTAVRPADVGLFHELIHAWHNGSGRKIFTDDHRENEYMTIGIPPFDRRHTGNQRVYTENAYRAECGLKQRLDIG